MLRLDQDSYLGPPFVDCICPMGEAATNMRVLIHRKILSWRKPYLLEFAPDQTSAVYRTGPLLGRTKDVLRFYWPGGDEWVLDHEYNGGGTILNPRDRSTILCNGQCAAVGLEQSDGMTRFTIDEKYGGGVFAVSGDCTVRIESENNRTLAIGKYKRWGRDLHLCISSDCANTAPIFVAAIFNREFASGKYSPGG